MCFYNTTEYTYLPGTEPFSILKSKLCRKYFLQKLHQFSQGNHVLDAASSNIGGFHWRDTEFLQLIE
jgi:hypothetical protein